MRTSVDLHVHLVSRGITHEFFRLEQRTRHPDDLAAAFDVAPEAFAVPTVLVGGGRSNPVLAVIASGTTLDLATVVRATGIQGLRRARPLAAARITGFPADWIPPVALDESTRLVVDRTLAANDVLYGPGGEPGLLVGIRTEDLLAAGGALVATVTVPVASMR